ncbi:MAG: GAF domain-containing sensor histidine kinase [Dehalococcoidia bacterium]
MTTNEQRTRNDTAKQSAEELATLLDLSKAFAQAVDLDSLLKTVLARSLALYEAADAAALFLYNPDEDCLMARASIGYEVEHLSQIRLKPGEGIVGKVFRRGQALLCATPEQIASNIANLRKENQAYFDSARSGLRQPRSAICAPLIAKDSVLGALILVNLRRQGAFSAADLRFLQAVANQIAIVVENARLWAEVSRAQAQAEANRFKDEFLASISHELLTPITSIRAAADLLTASLAKGGREADSLISSIGRNTQRLQSLVEELLDLARLQRGEASISRERWDLKTIVEESAAAIEPLASGKEQALEVETPPFSCPVLADGNRLEQALMNLLSNSCKFTPRHGHIKLVLQDTGGQYLVSVADDGPGIPLAEQRQIFERFYSNSRAPEEKAGAGLGLAIAKTVVELHGGHIWVKSEGGSGSTFFFTVPKGDGCEDPSHR